MTKFIVTDSEYTTFPGAIESDWTAEDWMHKEIVQIAAAKVDLSKDFNDVVVFETLVIPKINKALMSACGRDGRDVVYVCQSLYSPVT